MTKWIGLMIVAAGLAVVSGAGAAPLTQAEITRIVNDVRVASTGKSGRPAVLHETVGGQVSVVTGLKSRGELRFADGTLTRLGANTVFSFTKGTRDLQLQQGTMLLQVPKDAGGARITTAAVTAAITGTTILIEFSPEDFRRIVQAGARNLQEALKVVAGYIKIVVIEGTLRAYLNNRTGESMLLSAGQMIAMKPGDTVLPEPVNVDISAIVKTSKLFTMGEDSGGGSAGGGTMDFSQITDAIQEQARLKDDGTLQDTALFMESGLQVMLDLPDADQQQSDAMTESLVFDVGTDTALTLLGLDDVMDLEDLPGTLADAFETTEPDPEPEPQTPGQKYSAATNIPAQVVNTGTFIQTDPFIVNGGVTNPGSIYGGGAGSFGQYLFGAPDPLLDANPPSGDTTVFLADSFTISGDPVISLGSGGPARVMFASKGGMAFNTGSYAFAPLTGVGFVTENAGINVPAGVVFTGVSDLRFYARGASSDMAFGGAYQNPGGQMYAAAGRDAAFSGFTDALTLDVRAFRHITYGGSVSNTVVNLSADGNVTGTANLTTGGKVRAGGQIDFSGRTLGADTVRASNGIVAAVLNVRDAEAGGGIAAASINAGTDASIKAGGDITATQITAAGGGSVFVRGGNVAAQTFNGTNATAFRVEAGQQIQFTSAFGPVRMNAPDIQALAGLNGGMIDCAGPSGVTNVNVQGGPLTLPGAAFGTPNTVVTVVSGGVNGALPATLSAKRLTVNGDINNVASISAIERLMVNGNWFGGAHAPGYILNLGAGPGPFQITGMIGLAGAAAGNGNNLAVNAQGDVVFGAGGLGQAGIDLSGGGASANGGAGGKGGKLGVTAAGGATFDNLTFHATGGAFDGSVSGAATGSGGEGGGFDVMAGGPVTISGGAYNLIGGMVTGATVTAGVEGKGGNFSVSGSGVGISNTVVNVSVSDFPDELTPAAGANGGTVTIVGNGGGVTISGTTFDFEGGAGGDGGTFTLTAGGPVWILDSEIGGDGGDINNGARNAGHGGNIQIAVSSGSLFVSNSIFDLESGDAEDAGGNSGSAGTVSITSTGGGPVTLVDSKAQVNGGYTSSSGSGANGGIFRLTSGGPVVLARVEIDAGGGGTGTNGGAGGQGGAIVIQGVGNSKIEGAELVYQYDPEDDEWGWDGQFGFEASGGDALGALASGSGGTIRVSNTGGSLSISNMSFDAEGGAGWDDEDGGPATGPGGSGGTITITNAGGLLTIVNTDLDRSGGNSGASTGGDGGTLIIDASGGLLVGNTVGDTDLTDWSAGGGHAGGALAAGNGGTALIKSSGGPLTISDIEMEAGGGDNTGTGNAGHGGTVTILSTGGPVALARVEIGAGGGGTETNGGAGGAGGTITIQTAGATTIGGDPGNDSSLGVDGGDSGGALAAGAGGWISIVNSAGPLTVSNMDLNAGGGFAEGSGNAGQGGTIGITNTGGAVTLENPDYDVEGGDADWGNGGNAGTIRVSAAGDLTASDYGYAGGFHAYGGEAYGLGDGGAGGQIALSSATGAVRLAMVNFDVEGGYVEGGGKGGVGGSVTVAGREFHAQDVWVYARGGGANSGYGHGLGNKGGSFLANIAGAVGLTNFSVDARGGEGIDGDGGDGGRIEINAGGDLRYENFAGYGTGLYAEGGGGQNATNQSSGGMIRLASSNGMVIVQGAGASNTALSVGAGPISYAGAPAVGRGGSIAVEGAAGVTLMDIGLFAGGMVGGTNRVASANGPVRVVNSVINSSGFDGSGQNGGRAGLVELAAGGSNGAVVIESSYLGAVGGYSDDMDGGDGGRVSVSAMGGAVAVSNSTLFAHGGFAGSLGAGKGGAGGTVEVKALNANGDVFVDNSQMGASSGGGGGMGGDDGDAGTVTLDAGRDLVVDNNSWIEAVAPGAPSGRGGEGGAVDFRAGRALLLRQSTVTVNGGYGTNGGAGGSVSFLAGSGAIVASNSMVTARGGNSPGMGDGGDGGNVVMEAGDTVVIASSEVDARNGNQMMGGLGRGGNITITSSNAMPAGYGVLLSSANLKTGDDMGPAYSDKAGNITVRSEATSGVGIRIENSSQLLALAQNPGLHKILLESKGGAIEVANSTLDAKNGTLEMRNPGNILLENANLRADTIKALVLSGDGWLRIRGGTIDANSAMYLYGGVAGGGVEFQENTSLLGSSMKYIRGDTVRIHNGKEVYVSGPKAKVFANHDEWGTASAPNGVWGKFTGSEAEKGGDANDAPGP